MLIREPTDKVLTSRPAKSSERKHEIRCVRTSRALPTRRTVAILKEIRWQVHFKADTST